MPDYQKMYFALLDKTERAIELLIAAQQEAEEIYISTSEDTDSEHIEDIKSII